MPGVNPLPMVWLFSDARNDAALESALEALPAGSGFVFRHYHLSPADRAERYRALAAIARTREHRIVISGNNSLAAQLDADGIYGAAPALGPPTGTMLRLAAAHDGDEIQAALAAGADGIFLSPVFPTASHPDARPLGIHGFHVLAMQSPVPIIALGGMDARRAEQLAWPRWGAIDGLASPTGA
ncbi:thiamine phosphate synthase [Qipengyuania sp. MTN3-11]